MSGRIIPVTTGVTKRNPVLIACKFDEPAKLLLGKALHCSPKELDMLITINEANMIRGVSL